MVSDMVKVCVCMLMVMNIKVSGCEMSDMVMVCVFLLMV